MVDESQPRPNHVLVQSESASPGHDSGWACLLRAEGVKAMTRTWTLLIKGFTAGLPAVNGSFYSDILLGELAITAYFSLVHYNIVPFVFLLAVFCSNDGPGVTTQTHTPEEGCLCVVNRHTQDWIGFEESRIGVSWRW